MCIHTVSAPFGYAFVYGKIENRIMCGEISNYVLENRDSIEVTEDHQTFVYKTTGTVSARVEYGYYYDAEDQYKMKGTPYRNGFRMEVAPITGRTGTIRNGFVRTGFIMKYMTVNAH